MGVAVAYVTYAAVSLNPDTHCNPTLNSGGGGGKYGLGPQVLGLLVAFLSIVWASVMTTRRMAHVLGAGGAMGSGEKGGGEGGVP